MKKYVAMAILVVFAILIVYCKYLYDCNKELERDNQELKKQQELTLRENELKIKALRDREQALLSDKKELENEYQKILELKNHDQCYFSWSDGCLPSSVSDILQQHES